MKIMDELATIRFYSFCETRVVCVVTRNFVHQVDTIFIYLKDTLQKADANYILGCAALTAIFSRNEESLLKYLLQNIHWAYRPYLVFVFTVTYYKPTFMYMVRVISVIIHTFSCNNYCTVSWKMRSAWRYQFSLKCVVRSAHGEAPRNVVTRLWDDQKGSPWADRQITLVTRYTSA